MAYTPNLTKPASKADRTAAALAQFKNAEVSLGVKTPELNAAWWEKCATDGAATVADGAAKIAAATAATVAPVAPTRPAAKTCKELADFVKGHSLIEEMNDKQVDELDQTNLKRVLVAMLGRINNNERKLAELIQINVDQAMTIAKMSERLKREEYCPFDSASS